MVNHINNQTETTERLQRLVGSFLAEVSAHDSDAMLRLIQREELSMPRIVALNVVARRGAVSITEISHYIDLSLANTSVLVDKLVCKGLVTRAEDEHDRRHKRVRLTDQGQALVEELRATKVQSMVQRMLMLPPDLLDRVIDVLGEVVTQLPPAADERVIRTTKAN